MDILLTSQARESKEKVSIDFVPAILYGHGVASISLKVKRAELDKVIHVAGESNLITLDHDGATSKVLIKEVQRSGLSGALLHVDFFQVNMADKVNAEIPLHFVGESKAIKELSGFLIKDIDALEVECLPSALVDHIDIDISVLKNYHDEISTTDLVLPAGMKLANEVVRIIASVVPPRVQEVAVETPAVTSKEEPKIEKKDNK